MARRPPEEPTEEAAGGRACPHCGARYEPFQEYCLECGSRLPATEGIAAEARDALGRRFAWTPAAWFWPVLIGLLVAVLATGAVIAFGGGGEENAGETLVATNAPTAPSLGTVEPTITPPEPTTTGATTETVPPQPPPRRLSEWPAGRNGYTVILFSIPKTVAGRRTALAKARAALNSGLNQVGVLDSSRFSSLHPGYYVVFSGVYANTSAAQSGRTRAEANGYPAAYVRPISR